MMTAAGTIPAAKIWCGAGVAGLAIATAKRMGGFCN